MLKKIEPLAWIVNLQNSNLRKSDLDLLLLITLWFHILGHYGEDYPWHTKTVDSLAESLIPLTRYKKKKDALIELSLVLTKIRPFDDTGFDKTINALQRGNQKYIIICKDCRIYEIGLQFFRDNTGRHYEILWRNDVQYRYVHKCKEWIRMGQWRRRQYRFIFNRLFLNCTLSGLESLNYTTYIQHWPVWRLFAEIFHHLNFPQERKWQLS